MYEIEDVELLLLAMFTDCWQSRRQDAPDDDMPKAKGNKSRTGSWMSHRIDIERAWEFCHFGWPWEHVLTQKFGCEMTNAQIARDMSMTKGEINTIVDTAVAELLDEMNTGSRRREARDDAEQTRELNRLYQRAFNKV